MKLVKITPQEILSQKPSVQEMRLRKRTPIYAVFDNIRSLYNVGAMFRTSDAALVSKVFLIGATGIPPRKEIDKSALGATDVVTWEYCPDGISAIKNLKKLGVQILALELTRQSIPYFAMEYKFPVAVVVGNEVGGISEEILELCDASIDIPMLGRANSLNVATAYGIAVFEILNQFRKKHD